MESSFGNGMMTREMFMDLPVFKNLNQRNTLTGYKRPPIISDEEIN